MEEFKKCFMHLIKLRMKINTTRRETEINKQAHNNSLWKHSKEILRIQKIRTKLKGKITQLLLQFWIVCNLQSSFHIQFMKKSFLLTYYMNIII